MRLFIFLIIFISCAKGDHINEKPLGVEVMFGTADPCHISGDCEIVDYLRMDDSYLGLKFNNYFPTFNPNAHPADSYEVGQVFELNKKEYFDQSYNFEAGKFEAGCLVAFKEQRIIYDIKKDLVDEEGQKYSEVVYHYKRSEVHNASGVQKCQNWIEDSFEFNEELTGWETKKISQGEETGLETLMNQIRSWQENPDSDIHVFVVRYQGEYFLRIAGKLLNQKVETTLTNPDTGESEDKVFFIDNYQIIVTKPENLIGNITGNVIGNVYDYQEVHADKEKIQQAFSSLGKSHIIEVDPAEIPSDL